MCELRRRKVYRVAAGYAVAGWLIIQVAVTVFPILNLPDWSARFVVLLILGGFPIALVLGWAFDFGPAGIQVTPEPAAEPHCPPAYSGRRINLFVLAFVGLTISVAVGYFLFARSAAPRDKSIAVLPFSNFSDDPQNAYFADGIQDDVLTNLARIRDLKVISRTSVMPYRGAAPHNAREIGKALGVASILEGSVRRDGNRVRVNVQLIDASNDKHIWAQVYDRELTDVFAIQTDLAQEIASALQATLSAGEQERIEPSRRRTAMLICFTFRRTRFLTGLIAAMTTWRGRKRFTRRRFNSIPRSPSRRRACRSWKVGVITRSSRSRRGCKRRGQRPPKLSGWSQTWPRRISRKD